MFNFNVTQNISFLTYCSNIGNRLTHPLFHHGLMTSVIRKDWFKQKLSYTKYSKHTLNIECISKGIIINPKLNVVSCI